MEPFALGLVFSAVAWTVWVLTPLVLEAGLQPSKVPDLRPEAALRDPIFIFITPQQLSQASLVGALLGSGLGAAFLLIVGVVTPYVLLPLSLLFGLLLYPLPRIWYRLQARKRLEQFNARLMDLTLGLANGLRSGAALPQTLELISRDMGGVMAEEFGTLLHEYRLGVDLAEGLTRLCRRMPSEDLQLLMTAVRITLQAGGSLAEVLDKITATIRERTEFQQKLKTMTAQGRFEAVAMAAAPLVCFGLLYTIDPELMRPMLITKAGWCAIGAVVALEAIGFLWIKKIVTIEV
jgi:tight adherence protein B